jgi:hypothetical protein
MLLQQTNTSPTSKDREDKTDNTRILGDQNINPEPSIDQESPSSMTNGNASIESAKYREMCKFYCSPYNVMTKNHHHSANMTWRYRRRINHAGHLKPLPKIMKFKEINTDVEQPEFSGEYENMDASVAVTKWSEKKYSKQLPKATSVTSFRYTNGSVEGRNERDDDRISFTSDTIGSTPTDSTSETNTQDCDSPSTKSHKSKKKVQFVGIDNRRKNFTVTKGKKSKAQRPLQAAKPYAYIKDEKTGKLPVIYEEKGVLPPIVEKYTTNVSIRPVSHPCIAGNGNKYQMVAKRWRSVYDKIRPTNHMKTFTEVVYAVKARMDELKAAKKSEKYDDTVDGDRSGGKQETVKVGSLTILFSNFSVNIPCINGAELSREFIFKQFMSTERRENARFPRR